MSGIYDLVDQVKQMGNLPVEWWDKMVHDVPDVESVNRREHLMKHAKGKVVLDVGGTGPMADSIYQVAREYYSLDKVNVNRPNHFRYDFDKDHYDPECGGFWVPKGIPLPELIVAGEVIEHLSNPGSFLDRMLCLTAPMILTTPNAGKTMYDHVKKKEVVNRDHVAWYSYHTLKTLVSRHNWHITEWFWYNGKPMIAEGLIFHLEPVV